MCNRSTGGLSLIVFSSQRDVVKVFSLSDQILIDHVSFLLANTNARANDGLRGYHALNDGSKPEKRNREGSVSECFLFSR